MQSLQMLLASKTFWTIVATFFFNGLQAITPVVDPTWQVALNAVLLILGSYFHINPSQAYHGAELKSPDADKK